MTNFGKWVHAISTDLMLNGNQKLKMLALMNHLFSNVVILVKNFFYFMLKVNLKNYFCGKTYNFALFLI